MHNYKEIEKEKLFPEDSTYICRHGNLASTEPPIEYTALRT